MSPDSIAALLSSGRAREALDLARRAVAANPADAQQLHLLGACLHANGLASDAAESLREAVRRDGANPTAWNTLGAVLVDLGQAREGEQALRSALRIDPGYAEARFNLAIALKQQGDLASARIELEQLNSSYPDNPTARFELANVLVAQGAPAAAVDHYEALLARYPGVPRVQAHLAAALARLDRREEASALCDRVLASPGVGPAEVAALAYTLALLDRHDDAGTVARRAAQAAPGSIEVRALAGDALMASSHAADAVEQFSVVALARPRSPEALMKLGLASIAARDWPRAAEALERKIALDPGDHKAVQNLAVALDELKERDRAIAVLESALDTAPPTAHLLSLLVHLKGLACDWRGLDARVAQLREAAKTPGSAPALPQSSLYLPEVTAIEQRAWAESWAQVDYPSEAPLAAQPLPLKGRRLRVGYLSADFYDHATSLLMAGVLEHHDRSRFEIFAYSAGRDDGSPLRRRIEGSVDHFVDVGPLGARLAARRIAADRLDVLIDLGGYVKDSRMRVLAWRPAPVQGHFLGYPGTTGAPFVDFFVADPFTIPADAEGTFSERVLRMPACYQPNDPRRPDPPPRPRSELGLPENGLVLCSFNQGVKIRPLVFEQWCRLLAALPQAVLWLPDNGQTANTRLRNAAQEHHIAANRLVFAPYLSQAEHMARLRQADIAIDTFPCTSHTTASDAVWAGVPLVTTYGETFASRVAASVLRAAGCGDWAFAEPSKAFEMTLALARDARLRANARARLGEARGSALFDAPAFASAFESLLERSVESRR